MSVIRFKFEDEIADATIDFVSDQLNSLPADNAQDELLQKVWRTQRGFHISPRNQRLPFRDTATTTVYEFDVATGTYTGSGLASTMQSGLRAASVFSTHAVVYDTNTNYFTFTKPSTATFLALMYADNPTSSGSVAIITGFDHGTTYSGTTISSTIETQGNEHEIVFEFSATKSVQAFIIDGHDIDLAERVQIRGSTVGASDFISPYNTAPTITFSTAPGVFPIITVDLSTATNLRAIQLHWYMRSKAQSEIGRFYAGPYFEPENQTNNEDLQWIKKTVNNRSNVMTTIAGTTLFDKRDPLDEYEIIAQPIDKFFSSATKTGYENLIATVGNDVSFWVSFNSDSGPDISFSTFYGHLVGDYSFARIPGSPTLRLDNLRFRQQR